MTGIILAGGKALRMGGTDKALLLVEDEPIVTKQLRILKKIFKEIIIVTNSVDRYAAIKGVKIIPDTIPERGPLGGLYSSLLASSYFYNFVIACDMPFLNESVIRHMIENKDGYDVVIPKIGGRYHPLFGIYSKDCIPVIEELMGDGDLCVMSICPKVKSRYILRRDIEKFDKRSSSLININTPEDYEACLTGR